MPYSLSAILPGSWRLNLVFGPRARAPLCSALLVPCPRRLSYHVFSRNPNRGRIYWCAPSRPRCHGQSAWETLSCWSQVCSKISCFREHTRTFFCSRQGLTSGLRSVLLSPLEALLAVAFPHLVAEPTSLFCALGSLLLWPTSLAFVLVSVLLRQTSLVSPLESLSSRPCFQPLVPDSLSSAIYPLYAFPDAGP